MCACPQIMCAKYYELKFMFLKTESRQNVCLMQRQNSRFFGVRFERRKVDKKANLHKNWSIQTLFRVFWTFLPNDVKIDPFELYHFKVKTFFFETQCINDVQKLPILSNCTKFSAVRPLLPAYNLPSTYSLKTVTSVKFLAIENMPRITVKLRIGNAIRY